MWVIKFAVYAALAFLCMTEMTLAADDDARVRNIESAAAEIAKIQKTNGSDGAFAAILECYRRQLAAAKTLTSELEKCMAQDIIVTSVAAALYAQLDPEGRRKAGGEDPKVLNQAMAKRIVGVLERFNVPQQEGIAFNQLVHERGMQVFGRTMFPGRFPEKKIDR